MTINKWEMVEWGAEKKSRIKIYKAPGSGETKDEKGLSDNMGFIYK